MKTNARKYISLMLALCMVVSILPATALASGRELHRQPQRLDGADEPWRNAE